MASATTTTTPITTIIGSSIGRNTRGKKGNVQCIKGINSFNGLRAQKSVTTLGFPVCADNHGFGKGRERSEGRGGSMKCNSAAGEIFQIAAIMNGLTLVGVAVGFVLLRIEAFVEEAE